MYNLIAGLAIPAPEDADENVLRAQQFIDDNLYKPISVDDIADYAGLCRYHISRIFKRRPVTVPYQYLINIRLRHARELEYGFGILDNIAATCGLLQAPQYFISVFKRCWCYAGHK